MKLLSPKTKIFKYSRILFKISNCPYCRIYSRFIEMINLKLPIEKRIKVIGCDDYHEYDIKDPLIDMFMPYIQGSYPVLFIDGNVVSGSNSYPEVKAWVRSYLADEFVVKEENPFEYKGDCRYRKGGIFKKKKLICIE